MNIEIVEFLGVTHRRDLLQLYSGEYWTQGRTLNDIDIILDNSSFYVGLIDSDKDKLVAFLRVLTDHFCFSYIYDVIVHNEYRKISLGKKIIDLAISHPSIKHIENIELVCRKEMMPFYKLWGFTEDYKQSIAMRLQRNVL